MKAVERQQDDSPTPAKDIIRKHGLNCLTVHSATLHVKEEREIPTAIYYGMVSAQFAYALSASIMVVHSNVSRKLPMKDRHNYLRQIFRELKPYAEDLGIKLALENLSYASSGYGKNVEEMYEILEIIDAEKKIGVTLDFCHATATGVTDSLLEEFNGRLCDIHLSNRAHKPFDMETMELKFFVRKLKQYNYDGPLTLELSQKCTSEEISRTKRVVEKILQGNLEQQV